MKEIREILPEPPTEKQKEQIQEMRQKKWIEKIESAYRAGLPKEAIDLMVLVSDGGPCPLCGLRWERIDYNNLFGKGFYYDLACRCYPYCPHCTQSNGHHQFKHWLYLEHAVGSIINGRCPECSREVIKGVAR